MYPTSARWDAALRTSGEVPVRVEVWRSGAPVMESGRVLELPISDGSVRVDETSNVRRAASLVTGRTDLMPEASEGLLDPPLTDVRIWAGVRYTEGDAELVPVFTGRIYPIGRDSIRTPGLSVSARDYSAVLAAARFPTPWNVPLGVPVTGVIASMIRQVLPWVEVIDLVGTRPRTARATYERERWEAIVELADAIGAEVFFDAEGRAVIRPVPTVKAVADWTVDLGTHRSVMADLSMQMDPEGVYNAVTAMSSDSDTPVSATVRLSTGKFCWQDGFQRTRFYASPMLKTVAQCRTAAASVLARSTGLSQTLGPTSAPNWALDVGDTVEVTVPTRSGIDTARRVVSGLTLPLGPGSMALTVRTDLAAEIEGVS